MVEQERNSPGDLLDDAAPGGRVALDDYLLRIRTDDYLDAHPALSHALSEALAYQAFKVHRFAYDPEARVYRDWCDPQKRQAMERAFEAATKNRRREA